MCTCVDVLLSNTAMEREQFSIIAEFHPHAFPTKLSEPRRFAVDRHLPEFFPEVPRLSNRFTS